MFKALALIFLLSLPIFGQSIGFSEERYHNALDATFHKTGKIKFLKHSIEIMYDGDETVLIYNGDLLIHQTGDVKKELDLSKRPAVKIFFVLFDAVYHDNKKMLESYFSIHETEGLVLLTPLNNISSYVDSASYKKTDKKLDFLQINLSNKDSIRIEETNEVL
ncbi:MAG TPA: hypothetical protein VIM88_00535 [Sulfurovum sp.]|uniref:hypothetical protein n=1 Tax=Sulfurovum sp. TaxID=1969726 RepID=UPI002F93455E